MSKTETEPSLVRFIQVGMLLCACAMPISISVAEPLAFLLIACMIYHGWKTRTRDCSSNPLWRLMALFTVLAFISSAIGLHPGHSIEKCHRFILFGLVFLVPSYFQPDESHWRTSAVNLLLAFILGASCLAIFDVIRVPIEVSGGTKLINTGNMRDPQLYMVALFFNLSLIGSGPWRKYRWWLVAALLLCGVGWGIHFKRGVWLATIMVVVLMSLLKRSRKILVWLVLVLVVMLCMPVVQERIGEWRKAMEKSTGARKVLWLDVAPVLIKQHPFGVGFKGTTHEDLAAVTDNYIQPGLDHVHNNILQVLIETGWLGLLVWLVLMFKVLWIQIRGYRREKEIDPLMLACLTSFLGLMLNGMVEYNFGDTEIMMTMFFILGMTVLVDADVNRKSQGNNK